MVLGHSRFLWARYVPRQDLMAVLRSHVQAFTALGGVLREILYDQMRTAVLRDTRPEASGRYIVYNASLVALAQHYGRQRPLGIAALEDKILQSAVVTVMNAIYESDFLGFSYGFRPGRGAHDALDALAVGITGRTVNWVLDADVRGVFDTIDHGWLVKFIEHRIADGGSCGSSRNG